MSARAKYWRADGGYQDAPEAPPPRPTLVAPQVQDNMFFFPGYPQWIVPQNSYLHGPIGIAGLYTPPPPYVPFGGCLAPPEKPPPPPPEAEKKEEKKEEKKKEEKREVNPYSPPELPEGVNYMFDNEHTMIHIFKKAAPIWTEKYRTEPLRFKMFKVSVNFTPRMIIENTLKKSGDDCKGWAVTEAVERGDGQWDKGTTIDYDSDKAKGSLNSMGWSSKRGDSLPPVWLVVHKVDFK